MTKEINGAKVENHKFCTAVHYRLVDEKVNANSSAPSKDFISLLSFCFSNSIP